MAIHHQYANGDGSVVTIDQDDVVYQRSHQFVDGLAPLDSESITVPDVVYTYTPGPPVPPPDPIVIHDPAPAETMFGDTGITASSPAAVAASDARYGVAGAAFRWYFTGAPATTVPNDRAYVVSWKTLAPLATVQAMNGLRKFYKHEADHKFVTGEITDKNQWKSECQAQGLTDFCLTCDAFINSSKNPSDWLYPSATHIGVDFDGSSFTDHYHDFTPELNALKAWLAAHPQITSWGVPEFGANRATANDTDGTKRAAWMSHWCGEFAKAGAEYVLYWEYPPNFPTSGYTTPAEVATVAAWMTTR